MKFLFYFILTSSVLGTIPYEQNVISELKVFRGPGSTSFTRADRIKKECGLISIAFVLDTYDIEYDLDDLVKDRRVISDSGSSMLGLIEVLNDYGVTAEGIRCNIEDLKHISGPVILYFDAEAMGKEIGHFSACVVGKDRHSITIYDPLVCNGMEHCVRSLADLQNSAWKGVCITIGSKIKR